MNRVLALAFLGVMLAVVLGQAAWLQAHHSRPVTQIELHPSRLVAFMVEIRAHDPQAHDSLLLNLVRLRDHQPGVQQVLQEEVVVAEQLIERLTGQPVPGAAPKAP
ncbi:MAG: hypothetical protein LW854_03425 [Rubrivivax sp.]|jgi:hypothetical protein|nr:hypothetical protein [Rubrivivax sp.]